MESLRKWLNKPKADDKSLLARFYHADRALQGISSELDSFDGRAEPERCSRLVGKLRQGQDRVLVITNQIMDELLGDDRAPRAFRAKFPEEVLQESLAGQLWFGAECLAAGSSIMNREMESTAMRPLAKAVTKSLENVRSLLREQCLRNNIPNSLTLKLDLNDSATDKLYESLKIFDRLFAEFEFLYVSAMVQVKSNHEHEVQELISVLYSETLQRALKIGLLEQEQVDSFDPSLMFSIPRLSIVTGLIIYDSGPLNMEQGSDQMSEMFRPFRKLLIKMRDLLRTLNKNELYQLEKLLCTNEEINLKKQFICDDGCISSSGTSPAGIVVDGGGRGDCSNNSGINDMEPNSVNVVNIIDDNDDVVIVNCNQNNLAPNKSTMTTAPTTTASNNSNNNNNNNNFYNNINSNNSNNNIDNWCGDDDDKDINVISDSIDNLVTSDCASGYLIPNTNFGNLLQTNEAPLTDSFISSDDEYNSTDGPTSTVTDALSRTLTNSSSSSKNRNNHHNNNNIHNDNNNVKRNDIDSGICTENTSLDHSPDIENRQNLDSKINNNNNIDNNRSSNNNNNNNSNNSGVENDVLKGRYTENWVNLNRVQPSCSKATPSPPQQTGHSMLNIDANSTTDSSDESETNTICDINNPGPSQQQQQSQPSSQKKLFVEEQQRDKQRGTSSSGGGGSSSGGKYSRKDYKSSRSRGNGGSGGGGSSSSHAKRSSKYLTSSDTSSSSPSSSQHSEGSVDRREVDLALRAAGRLKFKTTENLLHRLFVCIAGVADQLQTNFAADLRQILKSVFLINSTPPPEEITIEEKGKESDLFEFRASESDVIQQENNSGGSNQSIYSAEEVNPEANDCVFEDAGSGESQRGQRSASLGNENSTRYDSASIGSGGSGDDNVMIDNEGVLGGGGGESGNIRNNIERSSSVGDAPNSDNVTDVNNSIKYRINITTSTTTTNNNNNNNNNNINSSSININNTHLNNRSRSNDGSPVNSSSRANAFISSSSSTSDRTSRNRSISATETPPRWIPDHEVRNCMACVTPFTPFRRRHHCRNCGGVFCNICSKSQKPLPKYGLIKAVRVCRDCFEDEDCN